MRLLQTEDASSKTLTRGPIASTLARFSLPLTTTLLLHSVVGSWSAFWVSRTLGANELVAVINANIIVGLLMAVIFGFGATAGIFIGQAIGANDLDSAKKLFGTAMTFAMSSGFFLALIGYLGVHSIADLLHMPLEARGASIAYFQIFCLSLPTLFAYVFASQILRSIGDARTPFIFSSLWIGLSFVLTPLFLTGIFGLPQFGLAGAAMASCIANALAVVMMALYVYQKDHQIALRGAELRYLRLNPNILFRFAKKALPTSIESIIVQGSYFALLFLVNAQGTATAAGYAASAQLWGYVGIPVIAIPASMSAMAAQNIGAGQWVRVEKIMLYGCALTVLATTSLAVITWSLGDLPFLLFLPEGSIALQSALEINSIAVWSIPLLAITSSLFAIVRANGSMLAPAVIFTLTMWGLRIPFAYLMEPVLGAAAIWWSFPLSALMSALLAILYYRTGSWRSGSLFPAESSVARVLQ